MQELVKSPFFSIIIPVYNVAPYLRECLDSVLAQTFGDWEAICVDDGSTDESGAILDEYAAKDKRFRVLHQPNAGVSVARNAALEVIEGKWFLFLDGDDILRNDGCETFLPYIGADECDGILVHPYIPHWDGGEIKPRKVSARALVEDATKEDLIFGPYAANGYAISRLYKRMVFGHLRFPVGVKMAEDVHFWFDALCISARWKILNAEYYLYRQRADSVCGKKSAKDCEAVLDSVLHAVDRISDAMGFGQAGGFRYIHRWPFSPSEYLEIFVAKYRDLSEGEQTAVFVKAELIEKKSGEWPLERAIKWKLWSIRHGLSSLVPALSLVQRMLGVLGRGSRLLHHIGENGWAFALGKVKRQLLRQGEYSKDN